jgi:hypothetical protein
MRGVPGAFFKDYLAPKPVLEVDGEHISGALL